jgi:hypothetical protein
MIKFYVFLLTQIRLAYISIPRYSPFQSTVSIYHFPCFLCTPFPLQPLGCLLYPGSLIITLPLLLRFCRATPYHLYLRHLLPHYLHPYHCSISCSTCSIPYTCYLSNGNTVLHTQQGDLRLQPTIII